jgi:hypothetical protein
MSVMAGMTASFWFTNCALLLQRYVPDLVFPFTFQAALDQDDQFVNGASNRYGLRHSKTPGMGSSVRTRSLA